MYRRRMAVMILLIAIGLSMVAIAAIASKTNNERPTTWPSMSRGGIAQSPGYSSYSAGYFVDHDMENMILRILENGSYREIINTLTLLARNTSILSLSLNISRATINGSLAFIEDSVAHIKRGQDSIRVIFPKKLYDGENILTIEGALLLKTLNKDDTLLIRAINITILNTKGDKIASLYIAIEIRDLTTGKTLIAASSPINLD